MNDHLKTLGLLAAALGLMALVSVGFLFMVEHAWVYVGVIVFLCLSAGYLYLLGTVRNHELCRRLSELDSQ